MSDYPRMSQRARRRQQVIEKMQAAPERPRPEWWKEPRVTREAIMALNARGPNTAYATLFAIAEYLGAYRAGDVDEKAVAEWAEVTLPTFRKGYRWLESRKVLRTGEPTNGLRGWRFMALIEPPPQRMGPDDE